MSAPASQNSTLSPAQATACPLRPNSKINEVSA